MAIPINSDEQVQSGATLDAASGGTINATEINGVQMLSTGSGTLGKIPIDQGDGTSVWADPLVQGLNADGSTSIANPVVIGGSDGSHTRVAKVDSSGNLNVANAGTFAVQATLAAETTKVIGVVRNSDGAGNLLTSNSTTPSAHFALDTNITSILGTAPTTVGKLDVKGADGDVFVRQATGSNLHVVNDAGAAIIGKVGIDQTTPGTTNLVAAGQNGTWTVQPGNTANTTPWLVSSIVGPAGVTPVFIGGGSNPSVGSVTTLTITYSPVAGNAVAITASFASASVSGVTCKDNNNNSLTVLGTAGSSGDGCMFYGFAVAGATTYTLSWTTSCNATMSLVEYSLVGGFGKTSQSASASTTTPNIAITTPSSNLSVLVAGFDTPTNGSAFTYTNNIGTIRVSSNGGNIGNNGQGSCIADITSLGAGVSTQVKVTLSTTEVPLNNILELLPAGSATNIAQIGNAPVTTAAVGTQLVGIADGAGNKITTNSTTYTAKFGLDVNILGSDGTAFSTAGVVDANIKNIGNSAVSTAASGVQKVGIVGNTGATMDGAINSGAAPTNALWTQEAPSTVSAASCSVKAVISGTTWSSHVANVKASTGNVYGITIANKVASLIYVQFYNNSGSPTLGTGVQWWIPVAASATVIIPPGAFGLGNFATGIAIGAATTATGGSGAATDPDVIVWYL